MTPFEHQAYHNSMDSEFEEFSNCHSYKMRACRVHFVSNSISRRRQHIVPHTHTHNRVNVINGSVLFIFFSFSSSSFSTFFFSPQLVYSFSFAISCELILVRSLIIIRSCSHFSEILPAETIQFSPSSSYLCWSRSNSYATMSKHTQFGVCAHKNRQLLLYYITK